MFGFLTSSSTTRLYRRRAPRQSVWQFYLLPLMRQSWETMTFVSASHIILSPTQPVGRRRPQRESNPRPPHQESRALPTELPRPPKSNGWLHVFMAFERVDHINFENLMNSLYFNSGIHQNFYIQSSTLYIVVWRKHLRSSSICLKELHIFK